MGFIGKVLQTLLTKTGVLDVESDAGGGVNTTSEYYQPAGMHSRPLTNDYCANSSTQGTGNSVTLGFIDTKNNMEVLEGETKLYSRNESGEIVSYIYLKNTGEIEIKNDLGYMKLQATGIIEANTVTIDTAGNIITPTTLQAQTQVITPSVLANNKELAEHTHKAGTPPNNTGPNN